MREGEPCAAIIRVYSTKAGILVVNDLTTGKHVGDAKTNPQAQKLADKACLFASKPARSRRKSKHPRLKGLA